ncbi:MAG: hypothetical protein ABI717_06735, partial [Actinomycetota bacterium]
MVDDHEWKLPTLALDTRGCAKSLDLVSAQLPPLARPEIAKRNPAVARPMEPRDRKANGGAHPLDLVLAPLVDR